MAFLNFASFPGNLCRDPGKFFLLSKDFSGTDIYHYDIKNTLLQSKIFFCLQKIILQNSPNFSRPNACEIKIFPSICRKIEKFKISLSKQHNKMHKMRSEMLKTRKKQDNQARENFRDPEKFRNPKNFPTFPRNFWKIFRFQGS